MGLQIGDTAPDFEAEQGYLTPATVGIDAAVGRPLPRWREPRLGLTRPPGPVPGMVAMS